MAEDPERDSYIPLIRIIERVGKVATRLIMTVVAFTAVFTAIFALISESIDLERILATVRSISSVPALVIFAIILTILSVYLARKVVEAGRKFIELDTLDGAINSSDLIQRLTERVANLESAPNDEQKPLPGIIATRVMNLTAEEIEKFLSKRLLEKAGGDPIAQQFDALVHGIAIVQHRETVKTNFNLIIGLAFSTTSIGVLVWALKGVLHDTSSISVDTAWMIVATKSSISIVSMIISLFFLQLYRNGVNHRQYYQNEITNLVLQKAAIMLAQNSDNPKNVDKAVKQLIQSERNFVLRKGESSKFSGSSSDIVSKCIDTLNAALNK